MRLARVPSTGIVLSLALAFAFAPQALRPTSAAAQAATSTNVTLCGTVAAFTAATASAAGSVTIGTGGPAFAIAPGTTIAGGLTVGSNVCIVATTNATGQLTSGFVFSNLVPVSGLMICGNITAVGTTSFSLGGATFTLASGATLTGVPLSTSGPLCLTLTLNASGQVTGGAAATTFGVTPPTVCGPVTAFTAATSTAPGTITINGVTFEINPGTTFTGTAITTGSQFCLSFTLGPGGFVTSGAVTVPLAATPYVERHHRGAGGPTPW